MKRDVFLSILFALLSIGLMVYYSIDTKNQSKKIDSETYSQIEDNHSSVNDNNQSTNISPGNNESSNQVQQPTNDNNQSTNTNPGDNDSSNQVQQPTNDNNQSTNTNPNNNESNNQVQQPSTDNKQPEEKSSSVTIDQTPIPKSETKPTVIEVNRIKLNQSSIELDTINNKTATLTVTTEPVNATDKTVTWTSSNPKVAIVNQIGSITAKAKGTTTITVKTNNGKSASCKVFVTIPATELKMTRISNADNKYIAELISDRIGQVSVEVGPGEVDKSEVEWINSDPDKLALERVIENGTYYIKSALYDKMVFSVAGGSVNNNAAIQLYEKNNSDSQQFQIINVGGEYYIIRSKKSGKVLDVPNESKESGTKIHQYTLNRGDEQKWEFEYLGDGYYRIRSKVNGLYLNLTDSKAENKTRIQLWTETKNKAQKFKLERISKRKTVVETGTYYIKSSLNEKKVLEVEGGSSSSDAVIQMYERNNTDAQQFEIVNIGNNYYVIRSKKSGKVLNISSGTTADNIKIQQYHFNGTEAQIWMIEKDGEYYRFKSTRNGLYLNVIPAKEEKYAGLQMYTGNANKAQRFKLEKISSEIKHSNIERILLKGKKKGIVSITAKLKTGKALTNKITVKEGAWEIKNGKYLYHYLDGSIKAWTISDYEGWNKLKEQKVKPLDPNLKEVSVINPELKVGQITKDKKTMYYNGVTLAYSVWDNTANNIAIKNGGSPYAITVDLDRRYESIFKMNSGVWEPYKASKVNVGGPWKNYDTTNKKLYAKNSYTPTGLHYTNGNHSQNRSDYGKHSSKLPYWVGFDDGDPGRRPNNQDYFHNTIYDFLGQNNTGGCVTAFEEHSKWIYYNIGRGTPVLIW